MTDPTHIPLDPQGVEAALDVSYNHDHMVSTTMMESAIRAYLGASRPAAPVTAEDVAFLNERIREAEADAQECIDDNDISFDAADYWLSAAVRFRRILAALTAAPALTREQEDALLRKRLEEGRERLTSDWGYWPEHILAALGVTREGA